MLNVAAPSSVLRVVLHIGTRAHSTSALSYIPATLAIISADQECRHLSINAAYHLSTALNLTYHYYVCKEYILHEFVHFIALGYFRHFISECICVSVTCLCSLQLRAFP